MYIIILIIAIYIFLILPRTFSIRDMSTYKNYYFAHRGLHKGEEIPENSLEAFSQAIENKYAIELDIQLTKDKEPVVFHDYSLKRVCGLDKMVYDLDYKEIQDLRLYNTDEKIPHLREVLELVNGKVPLLVELKMDTRDITLCGVVAPYLDEYRGYFCIESFNPLGLWWFRKNRPKIIRGQLSSDFVKDGEKGDKKLYFVLKHLLTNFLSRPDFIAYNYLYRRTPSFLLIKNLCKTPTFGWTIDSREVFEEVKKDFDIFIFENFRPE